MRKFPFYRQHDQYDCGPACLKMIAQYHGVVFSLEHLRTICNISLDGVSARNIVEASETLGLKSLPAQVDYDTLFAEVPLPCIAYWRDRHFVVIYKIKKNKIWVADPSYGLITYTKQEFIKKWQNRKDAETGEKGIVILFEPTPEFHQTETTKKKSGLSLISSYISKENAQVFQIVLGLIAGTIVQFAFPFLTQAIVDQGIATRDIGFIYVILIAQITLYLSSSLFSLIQGWLLLFVGSRASILIATDYLRKLLKKPLAYFDSKTSGDIIQKINDSVRIERLILSAPATLFSYISSFVFLGILFYYDATIFYVFVSGLLLYFIWVQFFMKKREELDYKRFDENAGINTSLIQMVNGISDIKVNNSELRRIWSWEEVRIKLYKTSISNLKLSQFQTVGGGTINELKNIVITFLAAYGVINGDITLGMMLAIQYIIGQINVPLTGLIQFIRDIQDAKLSMDRFTDIEYKTDEENIINNTTLVKSLNGDSDIHLENVSFRYGGQRSPLVLKDINLTIPSGKVTAIVGMSGSGKSTLLKLLLKLYLPQEGNIKVGGVHLNSIDTNYWRRSCGSVMQNGYIFSDSVARNITESNSSAVLDSQGLIQAVEMANIKDFIEQHPAGYNAKIGPPGASGRSLSGGQSQRILLARAIYKNPRYLFLDEATSALDANNESTIMSNLQNFYQNRTVIIIAHRLSTVRHADQIVVLKDGEIAETGNHESLVTREGHYFNLVKNQLEIAYT